ncbi:hypothetical protein ACFWVC_27730 [Streptomyces sp. NPDC058691]|uniref:hypothetical protein n=1 Tax=Streptomyces sp. NPDC058691 TaxID=3346601 RepID=UPI003651C258
MAYTVLYIAFGVVALWLLGEVLLQYKARLRWRLLAFAGFMGVVLGVYLPSVVVIVLGAVAFGTGQTFVTLSYRRGFVEGWALNAPKDDGDDAEDGDEDDEPASASRRAGGRRGRVAREEAVEGYGGESPAQGPAEEHGAAVPEGVNVGQSYDAYAGPQGAGLVPEAHGMDSTQVYQPMPMHEDSGEYPMYGGQPGYTPDPYTSGGYEGYGTTGYGDWNNGAQQQPAAASYDAYGQPQQTGGWETQQAYGTYGGYQDPYQQGQGTGQGTGAPQQGYGYDTPAGGVWVPQQGGEQQPYIPQQQNSYDQQQQPQEQQQPQQGQYDPYDPYRYN